MSEHPIAEADRLVTEARRFRYQLDLQYDGTDFSGMQWQSDRRTVQQCVEAALAPLFGAPVRLIPSSRTDAGVHARLQVAHVDVPVQRAPQAIIRATNSALPPDIRVLSAQERDAAFHARFSARWRGYAYRISTEPLAIGRAYVWQMLQRIDVNKLSALAGDVEGTHSFAAFAHENPLELHDYECTVYRSRWQQTGSLLTYEIEASRFVHGMVRMLVGTMLDVACGRRNASTISEVLASRDNRNCGTKAPACGLTLESVGYSAWPELR